MAIATFLGALRGVLGMHLTQRTEGQHGTHGGREEGTVTGGRLAHCTPRNLRSRLVTKLYGRKGRHANRNVRRCDTGLSVEMRSSSTLRRTAGRPCLFVNRHKGGGTA